MGKPEENRQLGRPRHSWKDNTQMDAQEIGSGPRCGLMYSTSGQGQAVGSCEHVNERCGSLKHGKFLD
jgi:hypothetical protein